MKEYLITDSVQILENTDPKVLFRLFKKYTDNLIENNRDTGIFSVDEEYDVFSNTDIRKAMRQL